MVEDDDPRTPDECQFAKDAKEPIDDHDAAQAVQPVAEDGQQAEEAAAQRTTPQVTEVEGDFVSYVKVFGDIDPGLDRAEDPLGRLLPITFQGMGCCSTRTRTTSCGSSAPARSWGRRWSASSWSR